MTLLATLLCTILSGLQAVIGTITAKARPREASPTAQLFALFERLLADWRNGTLPGPAAPRSTPKGACRPTPARSNPSSPPPPDLPQLLQAAPQRRPLNPIARMREIILPLRAAKPLTTATPAHPRRTAPARSFFARLTAPPSHVYFVTI